MVRPTYAVAFGILLILTSLDVAGAYDFRSALAEYEKTGKLPEGVEPDKFLEDYARDMMESSRRRLKEVEERRAQVVVPACKIELSKPRECSVFPELNSITAEQRHEIASVKNQIFKTVYDLKKQPSTLEEALNVIGTTPIGKQTLAKFQPKLESGEIRVRELTDTIRKEKRLDGQSAIYIPDEKGHGGTIYVDYNNELGLLIPNLFHEMVHSVDNQLHESRSVFNKKMNAMDASLRQAAIRTGKLESSLNEKDLSQEELLIYSDFQKFRDRRTYSAERLAYDSEFTFVSELSNTFPCYAGYIKAQSEKGLTMRGSLPDDRLMDLYHIDKRHLGEKHAR